jgi:hypothetical protein
VNKKWALLLAFPLLTVALMGAWLGDSLTNFSNGWKIEDNGTVYAKVAADGDATVVDITASGSWVTQPLTKVVVYNTTTTAKTIAASDNGTVFHMASTSDDPVTFTLPVAATVGAGFCVGFIDNDATAAADLCIDPNSADNINGGTDGVSLNQTADAVGKTCWLISDGTNWLYVGTPYGTWGAGT